MEKTSSGEHKGCIQQRGIREIHTLQEGLCPVGYCSYGPALHSGHHASSLNIYAAVFNGFASLNIHLRYILMILVFAAPDRITGIFFIIVERYGMNRTTKKTFLPDGMKSLTVSTALTSLLISAVIFFTRFGIEAGVRTAGAVLVFPLPANLLLKAFMRLFNSFTPSEEGELRGKLTSLFTKYGVEMKRIVVVMPPAVRRRPKHSARV